MLQKTAEIANLQTLYSEAQKVVKMVLTKPAGGNLVLKIKNS